MKTLLSFLLFALAASLCNLTERTKNSNRNSNNNNQAIVSNNNESATNNSPAVSDSPETNGSPTADDTPADPDAQGNTNRDEQSGGGDVEQGEVEQSLINVKRQWTQAIIAGDKATCDSVLADEFQNIDPQGNRTNKAQFCSSIGEGAQATFDLKDVTLVSLSDDTAIMTYIVSIKGRGINQSWRDTDTFVKRGGRWQIASSASSPAR